MRVNNFKELEKEEMKNLDPSLKRIKSSVNSNLGIFQFIGDMVEMFLPKLASILVNLTGGSSINDDKGMRDKKYPNR
ncbi:MAG: hypothetical protein HKN68_04410 [Saprospiraceae bacterium]|nr:hypothetical protein [Saprospiraceae bacterium]